MTSSAGPSPERPAEEAGALPPFPAAAATWGAGLPRDGSWRPAFRVIGILFVVFPIINVLSSRPDPSEVALVGIGTALFASTTIFNFRVPDWAADGRPASAGVDAWTAARRLAPATATVLALIAIAITLSLFRPDTGGFAFFYYASVAASTIRSSRIAVATMILAGAGASLAVVAGGDDPGSAFVQGLSVGVIGMTVYTAVAVRRTNRQLVAARHELARLAVAEERARIARDLHDTLGHSLSLIALKSELAGRLLPDDPIRAATEIGDVERVAREALASVRETVSGYRQPSLGAELAGARSAFAAAGIDARVEPPPEDLPPAIDAALAWAVREGVTNVVRHGGAGRAAIIVERGPAEAAVEIRNDRSGVGADAAPADPVPNDRTAGEPARPARAGSGLAGLRERVALIGGRVESGPLEGGGFRLRVSVPLDAS